jgi:SHS2 domain-containing protein
MPQSFVEFDHSGDVGIEAHGRDFPELICNTSLGLFALLYRGEVSSVVERRLRVTSRSREDLVVDWLNEVIAAGSAYGEIYQTVKITDVGDFFVEGVVTGENVDAERHDLRFDVKAATYHRLSLVEDEAGWQARVIFDL